VEPVERGGQAKAEAEQSWRNTLQMIYSMLPRQCSMRRRYKTTKLHHGHQASFMPLGIIHHAMNGYRFQLRSPPHTSSLQLLHSSLGLTWSATGLRRRLGFLGRLLTISEDWT